MSKKTLEEHWKRRKYKHFLPLWRLSALITFIIFIISWFITIKPLFITGLVFASISVFLIMLDLVMFMFFRSGKK